jgi:ORF6N domain
MKAIATSAPVEKLIHVIRNQTVMLDSDLARLYGVTTGNLNLAVKRNRERFPSDFMFTLTETEAKSLILQFATSNGRGGRRTPPNAFTEQGVAMLSSVLSSRRAIQVNIHIMRAFTRLKGFHASYDSLRKEIHSMRGQYDKQFAVVFDAINSLLDGPKKHFKVKGFGTAEK